MEVSSMMMVKCTTCSVVTGKPRILALKIATLQWHQGNYTAEKNMPGGIKKGNKYMNTNCRHLKNERIVASRGMHPVDKAIKDSRRESSEAVANGSNLSHAQYLASKVEFSAIRLMLQFLGVPKLPKRHWSDGAGWIRRLWRL
jgi:hypothetical protein